MDFFIFLIFLAVFILPALKKAAKTKTSNKSVKWGEPEARQSYQGYDDDDDADDSPWGTQTQLNKNLGDIHARIKTISVNQAKQYAAHKAGQRLPAEEHYHDPITPDPPAGDTKDADDKNRQRRSDWGQRAGPGLLSTQNILILLLIGFVLTILANTPVNIFN